MNLYKSIEIIKDFFTPRNKNVNLGAAEDIKILSKLADKAEYMRARNGVVYFYYVPSNEKDIDIAKFLMVRNGLKPHVHKSRYSYAPVMVLRILHSDIRKSPSRRLFVRSIKPKLHVNIQDYDSVIQSIRNQMHEKSR